MSGFGMLLVASLSPAPSHGPTFIEALTGPRWHTASFYRQKVARVIGRKLHAWLSAGMRRVASMHTRSSGWLRV